MMGGFTDFLRMSLGWLFVPREPQATSHRATAIASTAHRAAAVSSTSHRARS